MSVQECRRRLFLIVDSDHEQTAMDIIRKDFGVGDFYSPGFTVTGALFYNRDGTVQETPVPISQESWPELMAHVDKIFIHAS